MVSNFDGCLYTMPDHDLSPPPPQYTPPLYPETRPSSQIDTKNGDQSFFGPIQRRVSILVESSAASETPFSSSSNLSTNSRGDEKSALRTLLTKFGSRQNEQLGDDAPRTIEDICSAFNLAQFGTKVSIEASYPINPHIQRHQIIRGLEQAASVKRWVGGGKPAEAWGKLMKVNSTRSKYEPAATELSSRTLSCGTLQETPSYSLAISVPRLHFESSRRSYRRPTQTYYIPSYKRGTSALPKPLHLPQRFQR